MISVVLPVSHRNLQWLDRAIESTKGFADELIVVDDDKARYYSGVNLIRNPLITELISVQGTGTTKPINAGIAAATGNWISILCSDDYYDRDVQVLREYLETTNAQVVGSQSAIEGILHGTFPAHGDIINLDKSCCIHASALFRKHLWWSVCGFEDVRYNDWHFWKKVAAYYRASEWYQFIPITTYHHHTHTGTISARYNYNPSLGHEWGDGPTDK